MFGYTFIKKERLEHLEKCELTFMRFVEARSWFSGWKDLSIIWEYLSPSTYFGDITSCRSKYAEERGTTVYGDKKDQE